jgi:hypothetical protein
MDTERGVHLLGTRQDYQMRNSDCYGMTLHAARIHKNGRRWLREDVLYWENGHLWDKDTPTKKEHDNDGANGNTT